jgi:hypothetical protein
MYLREFAGLLKTRGLFGITRHPSGASASHRLGATGAGRTLRLQYHNTNVEVFGHLPVHIVLPPAT